jgi:hypothetical protein
VKIVGAIFSDWIGSHTKRDPIFGPCFRMYPILWSEIKAEMKRQACQASQEKKEAILTDSMLIGERSKEKKARRDIGRRPQ